MDSVPAETSRKLIDPPSLFEDESGVSGSISMLSSMNTSIIKPKIDRAVLQAKMVYEARVRVHLESTTPVKKRYSALFNGLRKNHPNNAAVIHPLTFMLRRIVYAAIAIFMLQLPIIGTYILCLICIAVLAYTFIEQQWEDSLIAAQHIVNEIALYLILLVVLTCNIPLVPAASNLLSWSIIFGVLATLVFNMVIIATSAIRHFKEKARRNTLKRQQNHNTYL